MNVTHQVVGGKEVILALREFNNATQRKLGRRALMAGARSYARAMKPLLPRGGQQSPASKAYGPLYTNVIARRPKLKGSELTSLVGYNPDGFYGVFLEYGTSRQAPRPLWRENAPRLSQEASNVMLSKLRTDMPREAEKVFRNARR